MKFIVFKWWESWAKPLIYLVIIEISIVFIFLYLVLDEDIVSTYSFWVSMIYALLLFVCSVLINKVDCYVADKIYEREMIYLNLKHLCNILKYSVENIDVKDKNEFYDKMHCFQALTERCKEEEKKEGSIFWGVRGFVFTEKLELLENEFKSAYLSHDEIKLEYYSKKLERYYKTICKNTYKCFRKIETVYGDKLQNKLQMHDDVTSTISLLCCIKDEITGIENEIADISCEVKEISCYCLNEQQTEWENYCNMLNDRLDMLEALIKKDNM